MPAVSYLQAVHDALQEEMRRDDRVFIMGEDVGFNMLGATGGFLDEFGAERVRNTPITEGGFTRAAAGAAMVYGGSTAAQHSDRPLALFMASPGLKIVAPSTPYDAKGLIKAAIREDDPVIVFEDGTLWTSTGEVPDGDYVVPLGQADVKREGSNVTVVAISGAVQAALAAADRLAADGVSGEGVDPRSLVPLDYAPILASVEKTGHLVVA